MANVAAMLLTEAAMSERMLNFEEKKNWRIQGLIMSEIELGLRRSAISTSVGDDLGGVSSEV